MTIKNLWCIADTHCLHHQLTIPDNIDIVIFAGDEARSRHPIENFKETLDFFSWFKELPIKTKIFVPGNHSVAIFNNLLLPSDIENMGINCLINQAIELEGIKFYGSPTTPTYGHSWAYMKKRHRMAEIWAGIPEDCQVLITHGPAKGILDLTDCLIKKCPIQVGCKALANRIEELPTLNLHVFGHLHSATSAVGTFNNSGIFIGPDKITRVNASCMSDRVFNTLTSGGYVLPYEIN